MYNKVIQYFIDYIPLKLLEIMAILSCAIIYSLHSFYLLILNPSLARPLWYPLICSLYLQVCFFFEYNADFWKIASEYISRNYRNSVQGCFWEEVLVALQSCWVYLSNINCMPGQKEEDP